LFTFGLHGSYRMIRSFSEVTSADHVGGWCVEAHDKDGSERQEKPMLSLREGWLFVHVPRTGGNSFQEVLLPHSDDRLTVGPFRDGVEEYEIEGPVTDRKHTTLQEYHDRLGAETFAGLLKFGVVRNPWERVMSAHFCPIWWTCRSDTPAWRRPEFGRTLEECMPITELISVDGIPRLDVTLRYESLDEDVGRMFARIGLDGAPFPHRNRGLNPEPWLAIYAREPDLIDIVAERYRSDIELYGYEFPWDALERQRAYHRAA
jgi:hypothetical protein